MTWRRRLGWASALSVLAGTAGVFWSEATGWAWLATPLQGWASRSLQRPVVLGGAEGFRLHLGHAPSLSLARLQVGGPDWDAGTPWLTADAVVLRWRWSDLWSWWRHDQPLIITELSLGRLAIQVVRGPDGRSSVPTWPGQAADAPSVQASAPGWRLGHLALGPNTLIWRDARLQVDWQGQAQVLPQSRQDGQAAWALSVGGQGHYLQQPFDLKAGTVLPGLSDRSLSDLQTLPVELKLNAADTRLQFNGQMRLPAVGQQLSGHYTVQGPSLAAVGRPFRLTLPTTPPFRLEGDLRRDGVVWTTKISQARIGRSQLAGALRFALPPQSRPTLSGRLAGPALWLADLGPAFGTRTPEGEKAAPQRPGRLLPDRRFDLPSLQAMDADVQLDLDRLEVGTPALKDLTPLHTRVMLNGGRLGLVVQEAGWAQGRVSGRLDLDATTAPAHWEAHLGLGAVRLEQALQAAQRSGQPPLASGRLDARVDLQGWGHSTAEWLASAQGGVDVLWTQGTVSHLLVEAAGLDLAQALGVWVRGDNPLKLQCGLAELTVTQGLVRPRALLVDTPDSTLWGSGQLSLATERLDLTGRVAPKDVSLLALRSPVRVRGTLADPSVSLDKGPMAARLLPAAALAFVNPLAAWLPLIDWGSDERQQAQQACGAASRRLAALSVGQVRHALPNLGSAAEKRSGR